MVAMQGADLDRAGAPHPLPLSGLRAIETGSSIAAAFCGKLLAAFGAEVVKVEPLAGDALRSAGPFAADRPGVETSLLFLHLNTGKSSVTLDPSTATGAMLLDKLAGGADIVIGSVDGGAPDSRALAARHPGLVVTAIRDFAESGPYADYAANELVVLALGGLLNMVGEPDREPIRLGGHQAGMQAALSAFTGTLMAVHHRDEMGEGQTVDVAVQEAVAYTEWKSGIYYQGNGQIRVRGGREAQWMVLRTADGFLAFVYQDEHWKPIVEAAGDPRLEDERFTSRNGRLAAREEIRPILEAWTSRHPKLELYHSLQARGVPVGVVAEIPDLLTSPQYAAREYFTTIEHPTTGAVPYPGVPCTFDGERPPLRRAPLLGEHNEAVYGGWLHLGVADLARLRERGVI